MSSLAEFVNRKLAGKTPSQVICYTLVFLSLSHYTKRLLAPGRIHERALASVFGLFRYIFAPLIEKKMKETAESVVFLQKEGEKIFDVLPDKGMTSENVIELCDHIHQSLDFKYEDGTVSGTVYHGGKEYTNMINRVMEIYQWSNPLHIDVFAAIRKMEAEIISMVLSMYNGRVRGSEACGALTSGGTESICMAVMVYRNWGRDKLGIEKASIVAPVTAHVAFDKACAYYGLTLIHVPVKSNGAVDAAVLEKYIRADTVAIVGSAPTFPHGIIDPIEELAEIAYRRGIGMHVDACLGGFVIPFLAEAGFEAPIVDFRNRGVTSISADTHKYGYSPKGTSCILYASKKLRKYQFFTSGSWPGGVYCSPGASGSKGGNVIAGTWAAMIYHGREGYVDCCKRLVSTRSKICKAINSIKGFRVIGKPLTSVMSFTADEIDIYRLGEALKKEGWMLTTIQFPAGLQFSLTLLQTNPQVSDKFIESVKKHAKVLQDEMENKIKRGEKVSKGVTGVTMYGSQQSIPDRTMIEIAMVYYLEGYYETRQKVENNKKEIS